MAIRKASARWDGNLREGKGLVKLGDAGLETAYSFHSRFEDGVGTNPEELLGAAHAGCFSMAFSADLGRAGYDPEWIQTDAEVHFQKLEQGWRVTKITLHTEAKVPGLDENEFQEIAQASKIGCPISNALGSVDVSLEAKLIA
jgi:osmotically inducible protein OsmC